MFRDIARFKQKISEEACIEILKAEKRGVLSVLGDDGYPYGMPLNHYYNEEDGHIYFHSGKKGHKIDAMKRCDKASFCVMDSGFLRSGEWALNISSVIVFGRIRFVDDYDKVIDICRKLSYKFTDDDAYIEREIVRSGPGTLMFELVPEFVTGKLVNEA